jgi:hypothetical protein
MKNALIVILALSLAACGSAGMHDSGTNAEAYALDQAALSLATTATSFQARTAALSTASECSASAQRYADQMKPVVDQMTQVAGQMDATLGSMGRATHADVHCSTGAMSLESAACPTWPQTARRSISISPPCRTSPITCGCAPPR